MRENQIYFLIYLFRTVDGKAVNYDDYEVLRELNLICSMCNDSSIDYNEVKKIYEKVGEPTEVALVVLVEKMNVTGLNLEKFSKSERAHVCNDAIKDGYKKVCHSVDSLFYYYFLWKKLKT